MMRSATFTALTTTALALLLAVSAAAEGTPMGRVIRVDGGIEAFAMDGPRTAYEEWPSRRTCDRIFILNVVTGTRKRVPGCRPDYGARELALAGKRIVWLSSDCGNSECNDDLSAASLPRLRPRALAHAHSEGEVGTGELEGTFISSPVGSGRLGAVNRVTTDASGAIVTSELDVIGSKGLRRVASGPNTIFAQEADGGRIAVRRRGGTIGIYNGSGKVLLEVEPSSVKGGSTGSATALRGDYLLVLTQKRTLEVYNSHSGALLRVRPVAKGATYLDAFAGVAVYAAGRKMHVLRLTTGKDVVLDKVESRGGTTNIQLEGPGLVYAKDTRTLVFVPLRRLLAVVS
jgi:hypothetical protein